MSKTTTNYKLLKPELTDAADITTYNENWDKIDVELKNINDKINKDYIVEQGTLNGWTYEKWASGTAKCWCQKTSTVSFTAITGNSTFFCSDAFESITYPFTFVERPIINVSTHGTPCWVYHEEESANPTRSTCKFRCMRWSALNNVSVGLGYYVIGRWK